MHKQAEATLSDTGGFTPASFREAAGCRNLAVLERLESFVHRPADTVSRATMGDTMTTAVATEPRGNFYIESVRALPRDLGYLGLTAVLLVTAYAALSALFWSGVSSIAVIVGIFLMIGSLFAARYLGDFEITRLGWAGFAAPRPVTWPQPRGVNAFWRMFSVLGSPHHWLFLLHALFLMPIVGFTTVLISFVWLTVGISLMLAPLLALIWPGIISFGDTWATFEESVQPWKLIVAFLGGVLLLAVFPLLSRSFTMLHFQLARLSLSGFRSDQLESQVENLTEARGAAISAEGHSLRRLERDIHDGPQQRLVRLQMDLASAERQLDANPEKARELIAEAMKQSKDALEELRALSRGFAPPILLDRGLVAALESAAVRSTVPARVVNDLPEGTSLPQEIERNAYFFASEAMANAAKHSGATEVQVRASLRRVADVDETWLDMSVTDNGAGGAVTVDGHGLAGLEQRLRGFGGVLEVVSPPGGPTVVSAHFPVTLAAAESVQAPAPTTLA